MWFWEKNQVKFHLGVPPKIGPSFLIWTKNYAKEKKKKEEKKENVGIFSPNLAFGDQKNH